MKISLLTALSVLWVLGLVAITVRRVKNDDDFKKTTL